MFKIDPFEPVDENYEAIVAIQNAVWPDSPQTVETFKHGDKNCNPNYLFQRLLVRESGEVVAFGEYEETPWSYQPGKYQISVTVRPEAERRGIGTAFYEYVMSRLAEREPKPSVIVSGTREDKPQAIRFLEKRGFEQVMRWPVSYLDVTTFEIAQFKAIAERVRQQGIDIYSVSELATIDSDWQHKLYELDWACSQDEPTPDPLTKQPLEQYVKQVLSHPNYLPQACFVALDKGQYVGLTELYRSSQNKEQLNSGFTGVLPSHRRQGIATALKLRAIDFARNYGAKTIKTNNEENNPMYSLNLALGFKPAPAWLAFKKLINQDEP
jgi:GNAT superfamily N-acetyltransferase